MSKNRSSSNKGNFYGNMGRVLFFTLALVVACCAVAVVLFETQVGLDLVAKVRGDGYSQPGNIKEPKSSSSPSEERKNMEMNFTRESSETRNEENANPGEAAVPDGDQESGIDKDTSSKVPEHLTVQQEGKTQDDELSREDIARDQKKVDENAGEGKLTKENEAEIPKDESHSTNDDTEPGDEPADDVVRGKQDLKQGEESNEEKEAWEYVDEKLNDEDNVEQPDTGGDKTNVGQEQVSEENRQDEPESYTGENSQQEEESKPLQEMPSENEVEEQQMESRETALPENQVEEVDDITGAQEQEDTISVGDNLAEFEEQRKEENQESIKKEESSKPIEPEGPPIDEYPRHARRGLRGDYGGKECKDSHTNCKAWASIGECTKNPIWMEVNCKKSCDVCSCSDNDVKCQQWSRAGECNKNSEYMNRNCMKSCGQC